MRFLPEPSFHNIALGVAVLFLIGIITLAYSLN